MASLVGRDSENVENRLKMDFASNKATIWNLKMFWLHVFVWSTLELNVTRQLVYAHKLSECTLPQFAILNCGRLARFESFYCMFQPRHVFHSSIGNAFFVSLFRSKGLLRPHWNCVVGVDGNLITANLLNGYMCVWPPK